MKINFPIDNDRDFEVTIMIYDPSLLCIDYALPEAQELYNSMTEEEKQEILDYIKGPQRLL